MWKVIWEWWQGLVEPPPHVKVLNDAADLIEKRGWIQHSMWKPNKGYCLLGALFASDKYGINAYIKAESILYRKTVYSLTTWNDDPSRTKAEVIKLLRDTAKEG